MGNYAQLVGGYCPKCKVRNVQREKRNFEKLRTGRFSVPSIIKKRMILVYQHVNEGP